MMDISDDRDLALLSKVFGGWGNELSNAEDLSKAWQLETRCADKRLLAVDEHVNRGSSETRNIFRNATNECISSVKWTFSFPSTPKLVKIVNGSHKIDAALQFFGVHTRFMIEMGFQIIDTVYFNSYHLMTCMIGGKGLQININASVITFEFPMTFDLIQNGNVIPLAIYHGVKFLYHVDTFIVPPINVKCLVAYCNTTRAWDKIPLTRLFYQTQYQFNSIGSNATLSLFHLHMNHPVCGLYFVFTRDDMTMVHQEDLVQRVEFRFGDLVILDKSNPVIGKSKQFLPPTDDEASFPSKVECKDARAVIFPKEVWVTIIGLTDNVGPLLRTCKTLWSIGQLYTVRHDLYHRLGRTARGVYCLPFNDCKLLDYKLKEKTLNMSRMDGPVNLRVHFTTPTVERLEMHVYAFSYNMIMRGHEMFTIRYSQ